MSGTGSAWRIGTPGFSWAMRRASVPEHVEPDAGRAHAQAADAGVVGLTGRVVGLGHVDGAGLPEQVDATDMVDVGLGGDDVVASGPGRTASNTRLWCGASKPMPRVDDDPAAAR